MVSPPANPLSDTATKIVRRLHEAGFSAFWVGGCVRDLLLGRDPSDYDVATAARPQEVEKLFSKTIPVGRKFGVVVVVEDGRQFQVATFRADVDYTDGRHPREVRFADAQADAQRRDFTINGLFYDPAAGVVQDWVGGQPDLQSRLIRCIGSPAERFSEDHLRLLRAVRLAAQLGFDIEPATRAALIQSASKIVVISAERIRDELLKLFTPPHAARGLDLLRDSSLLDYLLPEVAATQTCDQSPDFHPEGSVYNHVRSMLDQLPPGSTPSLAWAVLLHDVAKPATVSRDISTGTIHFCGHEILGAAMAAQILERLRFPRKQVGEVVQLVRAHMQFQDAPRMRKSTLRRILLRPTFPLELELHRLDCLGSHGRLDVHRFLSEAALDLERQPAIRPPLLRGDDLLALGMPPGPEMGALLSEIREKQLQGELRTRAQARRWARQRLQSSQELER